MLKIQAVEREKMIMKLTATSINGDEYQNWQSVKTRSRLSNNNLQIQTNNSFLPLEDWNEAENGNQEEICTNNNIPKRQREKKQRRRLELPITENYIETGGGYIKNKTRIVPGHQTYAETARDIRKIRIIGDSHIGRLNKRHFNEKINGKVYFNVFRGETIKRLHHFLQPTLREDKPDTVLIHIGSNDIIPSKQHDLSVNDAVQRIIDVGSYCRECGVKDVIISSILVKRNFHLTRIIRQINDLLSEYCISNNFHYLTNDNISRKNLWKDGTHLNKVGNNTLAETSISYVNEFGLSRIVSD